jgi:hypothetical protein
MRCELFRRAEVSRLPGWNCTPCSFARRTKEKDAIVPLLGTTIPFRILPGKRSILSSRSLVEIIKNAMISHFGPEWEYPLLNRP